jgi:hypothetical protein
MPVKQIYFIKLTGILSLIAGVIFINIEKQIGESDGTA